MKKVELNKSHEAAVHELHKSMHALEALHGRASFCVHDASFAAVRHMASLAKLIGIQQDIAREEKSELELKLQE